MRLLPVFLLFSLGCYAQTLDTLNYVLGKMNYSEHDEFVQIPTEHASRSGMYLRKEALDAFVRMKTAAKAEGVQLKILSAARNFNHQKRIWEAKWNGQRLVNGQNLRTAISDHQLRAKEILKYSSMPGTSRHHWGTDIDINSLSPAYFKSGRGKKEYEWLREHAQEFGFCQTYTEKDSSRPDGYEEEKWHWTYLPIATPLLNFYKLNVSGSDIVGFDGAGALPFSEVRKYVFGISAACN
jgi:LAS superfamily LD-carboxypeptidase LdcB